MKYRYFISLIFTLLCSIAMSASLLHFPQSEASTVGIAVISVSDGKIVASENIDLAMIPASTLKCVTSASALLGLGENYRFETIVKYSGEISDKVITGDLFIESSGDPTVNSRHFKESPDFIAEIISELNSRGIKRIKGDIIVDEESFPDPGLNPQWTVGDGGEAYGTGLYGFNFSDNNFKFYPATMATDPIQPYIDVVLDPGVGSIEVIHGVNSENYLISGRNLERSSTELTLPMNSPATSFAATLKSRLKLAGISVDGDESYDTPKGTLLIHRSPRAGDILRSLMRRSDNMMAEGMLRALSPGGGRSQALARERELLQGIGVKTHLTKIVDGSGLARMDRVTPRFLADMLVAMAKSSKGETYVSFFPRVGQEGTVKSFMRKTRLAGKLALKSGSINGVHCYAGYKLNVSGKPTHAVVVMVNNFFCTRDNVRSAISRWLLEQFK